jgi:AraC family transcriptional regulator, positive regulator of tynA and feaB
MNSAVTRAENRRWSTSDVDSQHALAYWVDTICRSFLEVDIDSPDREHFTAHLDQSDFGPATLCLVEADTQTVHRTRARIARSRYAAFFLLQLRSGQMRLNQYGRDSHLQAGDCILVDCNEPYRVDCLQATRCVALRFPHNWLKTWIPAPEDVAARPFPSTVGWGAALGAALANLDSDGAAELALPAGMVAEQLAALLTLAAGPQIATPSSTSRDKLLGRLTRTIQDRCHESELTPGAVADAHGISKRYLHYLFAQANTTFSSELMRVRLERAQRLLSDGRFAKISVGEVAARCGFVDPSHFARRFRKTYGQGPTQYRVRSAAAP